MAINLRCSCGGEAKLTAKVCPRCNAPFTKKGRKYKVTVRSNGRKFTKTVSNLELAKEIEGKLKVDVARGEFNLKKKQAPTVAAIWKSYLPWAQENKKSWKSDFYIYGKHLEPIFAKKPVDKISPFDVEKLMMSMKKGKSQHGKPYSQATIKHAVVLLSRLYTHASKSCGYLGGNPCTRVEMPKLNNEIIEYLTLEEVTRLTEVLNNWPCQVSAGFIKIMLYTGLRRGELFNLKWADVNFDRKTVLIRDPKGKKDQVLPLSDKAIDCLRALPERSDYVFPGKDGGKRVDFKRPWIAIKKVAALPSNFRLHGLRHHFASSLVSAGVDLYTVSKLLTHKDVKTTQRYAHLADEALRGAVHLSDSLISKAESASKKVVQINGGRHNG